MFTALFLCILNPKTVYDIKWIMQHVTLKARIGSFVFTWMSLTFTNGLFLWIHWTCDNQIHQKYAVRNTTLYKWIWYVHGKHICNKLPLFIVFELIWVLSCNTIIFIHDDVYVSWCTCVWCEILSLHLKA